MRCTRDFCFGELFPDDDEPGQMKCITCGRSFLYDGTEVKPRYPTIEEQREAKRKARKMRMY